jgi:hypothetical protein
MQIPSRTLIVQGVQTFKDVQIDGEDIHCRNSSLAAAFDLR